MERKFINSLPEKDGQIGITKQTITLLQNNDTWGDQEKWQQMNIETVGVDYDEKENRDFFFRMTTGGNEDESDIERFWSIEGPEELVEIFNEIAKRTDINVRWEIKKVFINEKGE